MRDDAGFTLIEVLVSLAIVAGVLGATYQAFSTGLRGLRATDERLRAALVADSVLAQLGSSPDPELDGEEGETAAGYRWIVAVRPYAEDASVAPAERTGYGLYRITVTVSAAGAAPFSLTSLGLGPARL